MQKTTLFLFAVLAATAAGGAEAQVPPLDIEKTCRAAQPLFGVEPTTGSGNSSDLGNSAQQNPYRTCMQSETAAKKSAGDIWSKVKAGDRTNCVGLSRMVYPSYVELLSCLQMYNPATSGISANDQNAPTPTLTRNRRL
ncbi:MAG TPA: hypothetical protein VG271_17085 [Beijerinckiaceae bacterium]|jgi:hypothetical protein|nr:hypothetical protein [Beijerinckiaceae bacterium]